MDVCSLLLLIALGADALAKGQSKEGATMNNPRRLEAVQSQERIINPNIHFIHAPSPKDRMMIFARGFAWGFGVFMGLWFLTS